MRLGRQTYKVDYGHLAFLILLAGYIAWFLYDAISVSTKVNNLLLVSPTAVLALFLAAFIVPQCFKRADLVVAEEEHEQYDPLAPKLPTEKRQVVRMLTLGGALGVFVFSLAFIGFDIAIFLFALVTMAICGERRPLHLVGFSAAVTVVTVYGFKALMSYPMSTLLL
jgi:Tripartite tricarboxylate transporter TctB family